MAYSTTNPPSLITLGGIDGGVPSEWYYVTADVSTTIDNSGYITNGGQLGMKVGDLVKARDTTTPQITAHYVVSVSTTAPGAVDLSNGTVIGAGSSNSD